MHNWSESSSKRIQQSRNPLLTSDSDSSSAPGSPQHSNASPNRNSASAQTNTTQPQNGPRNRSGSTPDDRIAPPQATSLGVSRPAQEKRDGDHSSPRPPVAALNQAHGIIRDDPSNHLRVASPQQRQETAQSQYLVAPVESHRQAHGVLEGQRSGLQQQYGRIPTPPAVQSQGLLQRQELAPHQRSLHSQTSVHPQRPVQPPVTLPQYEPIQQRRPFQHQAPPQTRVPTRQQDPTQPLVNRYSGVAQTLSAVSPDPMSSSTSSGRKDKPCRPNACERCRLKKLKCELDPGQTVCSNCAKSNVECVVTLVDRRTTDTSRARIGSLRDEIQYQVNILGTVLSYIARGTRQARDAFRNQGPLDRALGGTSVISFGLPQALLTTLGQVNNLAGNRANLRAAREAGATFLAYLETLGEMYLGESPLQPREGLGAHLQRA
ncbi:hypothetical protein F5Y16DRAFT_396149 [Xylariaceae sp. FL0255]|nr:hypothetical protein F5Y16DRAFT_396149 [Xylariaceae sp. FL0255]